MNNDSKQLELPLEFPDPPAEVSPQVETRLIMLEYEYQLTLPFQEEE